MRTRDPRSRSARYPRHWPLAIAWGLGLALSVSLLLALVYVIGCKHPKEPTAIPDAVLAAAARPGTSIAAACVLLLLGAWCLRHLGLCWLAWRPGRIEVAEFAAGSKLTDADVKQLSLTFRGMLAKLQLQAPGTVPGAAPEGDFLDVLDRSKPDVGNVLGTLINLLRAAAPTHAYELHGVLREREEHPRYGVTVQVVRLPGESSLPIEAWGETWEAALRRAADEATAAILPRTRRCRAPWAAWRGHEMPETLVHAYEEATRFEQDRRYDEALYQYYAAAELDPMNMVLRLRIGLLQERLGQYLDALAMYCGMLEADRPAGRRLPRRLYRGAGRRERRRALLSARYRRNVLLGGRALADDWSDVSQGLLPTRREQQRVRLRACLRRHLEEELRPFVARRRCRGARDVSRILETALAEPVTGETETSARYLEFRDLLAAYAVFDCRRLRLRQRWRRFDRRATLTPATIAMTMVCIEVRRSWIERQQELVATDEPFAWPLAPDELQRMIRKLELGLTRFLPRRLRRRSFRFWHEHYNAACVFALPLLVSSVEGEQREDFARRAVRRLEQATARADSAHIASRRDWLLSEDSDLAGLRTSDEFKTFEVMYLPAGDITPRRPVCVRELEGSRYVRALLSETAGRWQGEWHRRGELQHVEVNETLKWFGDEIEMWSKVRELLLHFDHSGTRSALIAHVDACAETYGFAPLAVARRRYETDPLPEVDGSCDDAAKVEIAQADAVLDALAGMLLTEHQRSHSATALLHDLERCRSTLNWLVATSRPAAPNLLPALCDRHAAMWQLFAEWVEADATAATAAEKRFRSTTAHARALWCAALTWWRALSPGLGGAHRLADSERVPANLQIRYQLLAWHQRRSAAAARRATTRNGAGPRALKSPERA